MRIYYNGFESQNARYKQWILENSQKIFWKVGTAATATVLKTVIPPGIASSSLALSVNLCYKLERRRNPYASEFEVAVKWELTDVSKAFKDRNFVAV